MADWITDDREAADEAACAAITALEALQSTDTWTELPLAVQRDLSRAHGVLLAMANAMAAAGVV
jgi:hypothetical protein